MAKRLLVGVDGIGMGRISKIPASMPQGAERVKLKRRLASPLTGLLFAAGSIGDGSAATKAGDVDGRVQRVIPDLSRLA
jgi:hypothetical protein